MKKKITLTPEQHARLLGIMNALTLLHNNQDEITNGLENAIEHADVVTKFDRVVNVVGNVAGFISATWLILHLLFIHVLK